MQSNKRGDVVIKVEHVSKAYYTGTITARSVRNDKLYKKTKNSELALQKAIEHDALHGTEGHRLFKAIDDVSFEVYRGDAVGFIGKNGSGKSTMLKILSRITVPTTGHITIRGRSASMLEVGTGFNMDMTGRENIYLNGAILGMSRAEVTNRLDDIIDFSECGEFIDTPVKRYSSGMLVKLAFSVSANLKCDILLLDEVLAVGDVNYQQKCLARMKKIARDEDRTVIFVTHNMQLMQQLCNRCILLDKGKLIYDGDIAEATRLYYGKELNYKKHYEYEPQEPITEDKKAVINWLEIVGKDEPVFNADEPLRFRVGWEARRALKDAYFRCVVKSGGVEACGMVCFPKFSIEASKDNVTELSLDLSTLPEGKYACDLFIGDYRDAILDTYDFQPMAFGFSIYENRHQNGMRWSSGTYGSAVLNRAPDAAPEDK